MENRTQNINGNYKFHTRHKTVDANPNQNFSCWTMTRTLFEFLLLYCVPVPSREYWFSEPKRSHFDLGHKAGLQKKCVDER